MSELGKGIEHLSAVLNRHLTRIAELEAENDQLKAIIDDPDAHVDGRHGASGMCCELRRQAVGRAELAERRADQLAAELRDMTEARDVARAALTEAIAVVDANDWQARMWDRVFAAERAAKAARGETAAMRRDHEAMEALRSGKVAGVSLGYVTKQWCAEEIPPLSHPGDSYDDDPAEAIIKVSKAGGE